MPLSEWVLEEQDLDAVVSTYRSGWLTMGPRTEQFEDAFRAYAGAGHCVAVSSGTAALHLLCLAAGLGPGDEVVVPSLTFVATANAVSYVGATPVFADIGDVTRPWLTAETCQRALTPRTRAVLYVEYGGHPGAVGEVRALCEERGLLLLEDAAHAAGSRLHGRHLGTIGRAGAFSLFSNKNLAVGEGGAVVTDDPQLAARVRLLRSHGMTTLTWDRHRGHAATYDVVERGFNYRIDEPRAALATSRLRRLDAENARRALLAAEYRAALEPLGLTPVLPHTDGLTASHHLFAALVPVGVQRDEFRRHLRRQGIQTSLHYPPLHLTSLYRDGRRLPVTEDYAARAVTLPLFSGLSDDQQDAVIAAAVGALDPVAP